MPLPGSLPPLYLGIDGGGSGLRVLLADAGLTTYGQAEGPGANPSVVGRARAAEILRRTVRGALGDVPAHAVVAVGIGVAGAAASHSRAWLLEVLGGVLPAARVAPSADYEIALVGALGRRQGMIVLAGTGALAYGVNGSGESALAGGWGYLLGDEGGGYWLGIEGLRAVLHATDGRGQDTTLTARLLPALGLLTALQVIPWLYGDAPRTAEVAALAPLVLEAAEEGDACAARIVECAGEALAIAAEAVRRRLACADLPLAFSGGLLSDSGPLSAALCRRLGLAAPPRPLHPPVIGAVVLARDTPPDQALLPRVDPFSEIHRWNSTEACNPRTATFDSLDTPDVLALINAEDDTVSAVVRAALPQLALAVDAAAAGMRQGGRMIYVGAGTSGRLGVLDAAECVPTFGLEPGRVVGLIAGGPEALARSIEGAEDDGQAGARDLLALGPGPQDLVVGLAASGRTPYVLGALEAARHAGARTMGIACNAPSPLLEAADIAIALVVGPEAIAGSTRLKAGTAQKMALNLLSTATMIRLGKTYGNLMVDLRVTNGKLAERAVRIVCAVAPVEPARARVLLEESGWRVKPAIVMAALNVPLDEAERRLSAADGALDRMLGPAHDAGRTSAWSELPT